MPSARRFFPANLFVQSGMMVLGVIADEHGPAPCRRADTAEIFEEGEEGFAVEPLFLAAKHQLAIPRLDRPEVANTLAHGVVEKRTHMRHREPCCWK